MKFVKHKYYATMEVYSNLTDMHTPGIDNGKIYQIFREKNKQVGNWYYFIPTTVGLYWLWKIRSESDRTRNPVGYADE